MLFLHRNNRMELLLEDLSLVLAVPRNNVFQPEVIVVQSQGMERWLSMGLAARFGVWANGTHPFPRAFIESASDQIIGPADVARRYTREAMALHLAQILGTLPEDEALAPLYGYLTARPGVEARLQLAEQLADAFDQVQIYRPDWCFNWVLEKTSGAVDFRPTLFRLLTERLGERHFPAQIARLIEQLEREDFDPKQLPERICLFGVATLPPLFLRVFDALARHIPVHWFLLTATREYVGAERDRRELAHAAVPEGPFVETAMDGFQKEWSSQQPLLTSFGRIMRDVGLLLERDCHYVEAAGHAFVEPATTSVLETLQADLCALRRRGLSVEVPKLPLRADDRSLQVHACHGPRRELEVLRQLLLDAFECDPTLRPEDVIVLLRDVETYAPLVDAVFASERGQVGNIPYRLSDRNLGASNPIAEAMATLLEVVRVRMSSMELMRILELGPIASRFGLNFDDRSRVRYWLRKLHVTWGIDMPERLRAGAAGQPENTIRWGLSRLLLGAAIEGNEAAAWRGHLPFDIEGDEAELVGRFVECAETVFAWRERFALPRSFGEWHRSIAEAMKELFKVEAAEAWQLADLLQTTANLSTESERASFVEALPAKVVAEKIREHYENTRNAQTLLASGVTFCAMLPMRGIPARIVAMVGLDDGTFPRAPSTSSFDDVARSPARPGDRVGRDEDRHLFLETLLAARERLIITYQGRNPRDDTVRPRSVVVDELLSVVDESFESQSTSGQRPSQRLTIVHPLHAHSARYFDGSDVRLVLRDVRQYHAATTLGRSRFLPESGMLEALLPLECTDLELSAFERFWAAPAEFFFQVRLGALLEPERPAAELLDPTELDGLGRYQLALAQWQAIHNGRGDEDALALWTAKGQRPFANLGKVVHDEQLAVTRRICALMEQLGAGGSSRMLELSLDISGVELRAVLVDCYGVGRIDWSPARLSGKHRVVAWLRHLLLAACGRPTDSWLLRAAEKQEDDVLIEKLPALEPRAAAGHLSELLAMFRQGQRAPLAFFPQISWDYATRIHKGEPSSSCLERALREYGDPLTDDSDEFKKPLLPREVVRLFGVEAPLTDAWPKRFGIDGFPGFAQLSEAVFLPYLDCVERIDPDTVACLVPYALRAKGERT